MLLGCKRQSTFAYLPVFCTRFAESCTQNTKPCRGAAAAEVSHSRQADGGQSNKCRRVEDHFLIDSSDSEPVQSESNSDSLDSSSSDSSDESGSTEPKVGT